MSAKSLRDFIKPPRTTELPYNVTLSELAELRELRQRPEWDTLQAVLDRVLQARTEQLLLTRDLDFIMETRGAVAGLREAALLVDRLLLEHDTNVRKRDERAEPRRDEYSERALFYGTEFAERPGAVQVRRGSERAGARQDRRRSRRPSS